LVDKNLLHRTMPHRYDKHVRKFPKRQMPGRQTGLVGRGTCIDHTKRMAANFQVKIVGKKKAPGPNIRKILGKTKGQAKDKKIPVIINGGE